MSSCRLNGGARYENKIGKDLLLAVRVSPRVRRSSIPHTHIMVPLDVGLFVVVP